MLTPFGPPRKLDQLAWCGSPHSTITSGPFATNMKFIAVIPARYASTRFPGKPLAILGGKTVIQRVYEQAMSVLPEPPNRSMTTAFGAELFLMG